MVLREMMSEDEPVVSQVHLLQQEGVKKNGGTSGCKSE